MFLDDVPAVLLGENATGSELVLDGRGRLLVRGEPGIKGHSSHGRFGSVAGAAAISASHWRAALRASIRISTRSASLIGGGCTDASRFDRTGRDAREACGDLVSMIGELAAFSASAGVRDCGSPSARSIIGLASSR